MARRILVPQPGIQLVLTAIEIQSLNHWTTREGPSSQSRWRVILSSRWSLVLPFYKHTYLPPVPPLLSPPTPGPPLVSLSLETVIYSISIILALQRCVMESYSMQHVGIDFFSSIIPLRFIQDVSCYQ